MKGYGYGNHCHCSQYQWILHGVCHLLHGVVQGLLNQILLLITLGSCNLFVYVYFA